MLAIDPVLLTVVSVTVGIIKVDAAEPRAIVALVAPAAINWPMLPKLLFPPSVALGALMIETAFASLTDPRVTAPLDVSVNDAAAPLLVMTTLAMVAPAPVAVTTPPLVVVVTVPLAKVTTAVPP